MKTIEIDDILFEKLIKLSSRYGKKQKDLIELILMTFLEKYKFIYNNTLKEENNYEIIESFDELEVIMKEL